MKIFAIVFSVLVFSASLINAVMESKSLPQPGMELVAAHDATGNIITVMLYYLGNQMYSLQLCALEYQTEKYIFIQELIPSKLQLQVVTYTTFDEDTRAVTVLAENYPSVAKATFWKSTINDYANASTPVVTAVTIPYPVSSSPFPLDVAPLQVSRLLLVGGGRQVVIFTNGEVISRYYFAKSKFLLFGKLLFFKSYARCMKLISQTTSSLSCTT